MGIKEEASTDAGFSAGVGGRFVTMNQIIMEMMTSPREELPNSPGPDGIDDSPRPGTELADRLDYLTESQKYAYQFMDTSVDRANEIIGHLTALERTIFRMEADDEFGTEVENIRAEVGSWHGTAATRFRQVLDDLENSLQLQWEGLLVIREVFNMHRRTVLAAREGVLLVLEKTVQALREEAQAQENHYREGLKGVFNKFVGTVLDNLATGGPVMTAKGVVEDLGPTLLKEIPNLVNVPDEDPLPILQEMREKLENLRKAVHEAEAGSEVSIDSVARGFRSLESFVSPDGRDYKDTLAPQVYAV